MGAATALVLGSAGALPWELYAERAREFFAFKYAFVADALIASVLVGVLCGVVGVFLVLRGLSLLGDAAGHATLPGLAVAFMVTSSLSPGPLLAGAMIAALLSALVVGVISRGPRSRSDAAIGIVLSVFFGVGIVLLSVIQATATTSYAGLDQMLLGNVAGITSGQLAWLGAVTVVGIALVGLFWRPLTLSTFDDVFARALGIPTRWIHYMLLLGLSATVVVSIQSVGVVLVSAMLIIPASSGLFLAKRLWAVVVWSAGIGAVSGAIGAFMSYIQEGISTGPAMVLVASMIFGVSYVFGPRHGVLRRAVSKRRRSR